ncbi:hypothetical protein VTO42DRAFT_3239 [Malbranchea cinnamomea]
MKDPPSVGCSQGLVEGGLYFYAPSCSKVKISVRLLPHQHGQGGFSVYLCVDTVIAEKYPLWKSWVSHHNVGFLSNGRRLDRLAKQALQRQPSR